MKTFRSLVIALAMTVSLAVSASAHIVFQQKTASPGPYRAVLGVTHGCSGSPTTAVRVTIPEGVIGVKPMPKPGWTLSTTKAKYARSYDYFHGAKLAEGAKEIVWSGGTLPDDFYDEFTFIAFVSDAFRPGDTIYFPVVQQCETGKTSWSEIPEKGVDAHTLKAPAPALQIVPGEPHTH